MKTGWSRLSRAGSARLAPLGSIRERQRARFAAAASVSESCSDSRTRKWPVEDWPSCASQKSSVPVCTGVSHHWHTDAVVRVSSAGGRRGRSAGEREPERGSIRLVDRLVLGKLQRLGQPHNGNERGRDGFQRQELADDAIVVMVMGEPTMRMVRMPMRMALCRSKRMGVPTVTMNVARMGLPCMAVGVAFAGSLRRFEVRVLPRMNVLVSVIMRRRDRHRQ